MKKTKILALCLVTLALLITLVSCGGEKPPADPDATETVTAAPEKNKKEISWESLAEYTIVAPMVGGDSYADTVSLIRDAISKKYGISVRMSDDFLMGDDKPSGREIVLGEAKRDFVLDEFIPYDSYHIYFSGENIVINGGSIFSVEAAAEYFVSLLEEGGLVMNEDGYFKETEYPLGNLKINGTYIDEYKIITRGTAYGTKYAALLLQQTLRELTGFELKITSGNSKAAFYIESKDSEDGMYHIEVENTSVTLYGTGFSGASVASNALLETIGRSEDVTLESVCEPMFTLENVKKKLSDGKLSIGIVGASLMQGKEKCTRSLCEFFLDDLKAEYPDCEIQMKNHSLGGKNTYWGLYSLESELLSEGYSDLFIIAVGGNDGPYGAGYDETAINYQSMIEKIYKNNPETEILFFNYGRKNEVRNIGQGNENVFMKAMLDVADYYKIPIVDTTLELYNVLCREGDFDTDWSKYIADEVHANDAGQELYGNMLWRSVKAALDGSEGEEITDCYMPNEPLFENSKVNAVKHSWESIKNDVIFGTGDEAGWEKDGTVTRTGASISYAFEGIGLELGIKQNLENAYFLRIQIFDENGQLVLEEERDTGYYYHLFITNTLEYGKYTVRLTVTRPSEKYPSERPSLALTDLAIIK